MQQNKGIVVRAWQAQGRLMIFDRVVGLMYANFSLRKQLGATYLISYSLVNCGRQSTLKDIKIEQVPLFFARADIVFLHHIIEILQYTLPRAVSDQELFDEVWGLFFCEGRISGLTKLLFLSRLMFRVGFVDDAPAIPADIFDYLISPQPMVMLEERLAKSEIDALILWVKRALHCHPYKQRLKIVWTMCEAMNECY